MSASRFKVGRASQAEYDADRRELQDAITRIEQQVTPLVNRVGEVERKQTVAAAASQEEQKRALSVAARVQQQQRAGTGLDRLKVARGLALLLGQSSGPELRFTVEGVAKGTAGALLSAVDGVDYCSPEAVDDRVAALLVAGANVALTYDDNGDGAGGAVTVDVAASTAWSVTTQTGAYAVPAAGTFTRCDADGGGFTVTLPDAAANEGRRLAVQKVDAGANVVTVAAAAGGDALEVPAGAELLSAPFQTLHLISTGTGWAAL